LKKSLSFVEQAMTSCWFLGYFAGFQRILSHNWKLFKTLLLYRLYDKNKSKWWQVYEHGEREVKMAKKAKFRPKIDRVNLNPEQAVLTCEGYGMIQATVEHEAGVDWGLIYGTQLYGYDHMESFYTTEWQFCGVEKYDPDHIGTSS
jgi:hypothetical protein